MQRMNQSGMLKITHKARVTFSIGSYIDTVDCDVAPLTACHLLLGRPWQFDHDATHGGHSNTYPQRYVSCAETNDENCYQGGYFSCYEEKKDPPMDTPKLRMALF
jgi:hypothetical protein